MNVNRTVEERNPQGCGFVAFFCGHHLATTTEKERAYRRGFQHGALQALIALQGGATLDDLRRWAERVDDWRWHRVDDTLPPSPIGGER